MEDYSNSFFKPKPRCAKSKECMDLPCTIDAFACTEGWWNRNIKTFVKMIEDEFDVSVTIDTDKIDDGKVDVRADNKYIMSCKSKEDVSLVLKTMYSMLGTFEN